jgi:hypothetical protein
MIVAPRRRAPAAIAGAASGGVQCTGVGFGDAGQQPRHLGAVDQPGVELIFAGVFEPGLHSAKLLGIFAEIHDTGGTEARFRINGPVHPFP